MSCDILPFISYCYTWKYERFEDEENVMFSNMSNINWNSTFENMIEGDYAN